MNDFLSFLADRDFIVQRQKDLQDFLRKVLDNEQLANNLNTKRFLDFESYTLNFQGIKYYIKITCNILLTEEF